MKERVNYIIDEGYYCAYPVNFPMLIVQAKNENDMKIKITGLMNVLIDHMKQVIENDDFEYKEVTPNEWR